MNIRSYKRLKCQKVPDPWARYIFLQCTRLKPVSPCVSDYLHHVVQKGAAGAVRLYSAWAPWSLSSCESRYLCPFEELSLLNCRNETHREEVSSDQSVYGSFPFPPSKRALVTQLLAIGVHALFTFPLDALTYRKPSKLHWAKETRRKVAQVGCLVGRAVAWK